MILKVFQSYKNDIFGRSAFLIAVRKDFMWILVCILVVLLAWALVSDQQKTKATEEYRLIAIAYMGVTDSLISKLASEHGASKTADIFLQSLEGMLDRGAHDALLRVWYKQAGLPVNEITNYHSNKLHQARIKQNLVNVINRQISS